VVGNVYDAPTVLGRRFDVVYTGKGALGWLPDIEAWAEVVAGLLSSGGCLYLNEFHPFTDIFGSDDLAVEHGYFREDAPFVDEAPGSYASGDAVTVHNRTGEWNHPLGDVVSALTARGLRVTFLRELPFTLFPRWPWLERDEHGVYRCPGGQPTLPLMYSLGAVAG